MSFDKELIDFIRFRSMTCWRPLVCASTRTHVAKDCPVAKRRGYRSPLNLSTTPLSCSSTSQQRKCISMHHNQLPTNPIPFQPPQLPQACSTALVKRMRWIDWANGSLGHATFVIHARWLQHNTLGFWHVTFHVRIKELRNAELLYLGLTSSTYPLVYKRLILGYFANYCLWRKDMLFMGYGFFVACEKSEHYAVMRRCLTKFFSWR